MSGLAVEFEVLPGEPGVDPSPEEVLQELHQQLQNPGSRIRTGDFGLFASVASLQAAHDVGLPELSPVGHEHPGQHVDLHTGHSPGPLDSARSRHSSMISATSPSYVGRDGGLSSAAEETAEEISHRMQRIERQLARTAAGGRDPGGRHARLAGLPSAQEAAELEEKYAALQKRLATAEQLIQESKAKSVGVLHETEHAELMLRERGEQLAFAKDQWVKETIRASKLADTVTSLEDRLAERDRMLQEVSERYHTSKQEVKQLQHLVGAEAVGAGMDPRSLDPHYTERPKPKAPASSQAVPSSPPKSGWPTSHVGSLPLPDNNSERYRYLCLTNDAILYEDRLLQIGVKAEYAGAEGRLAVYFANKGATALQAFSVQYIVNDGRALRLDAAPLNQQLDAGRQVCQMVNVHCLGPFSEPPWLRVQFLLADASPWRGQMKFPIVLTKFMTGADMTPSQFFTEWRRQNYALSESSGLVVLAERLQGQPVQIARLVVFGGALQLHYGIDPSPDSLVLVGQLASQDTPEIALVRVEIGTGRFAGKARVSVRSGDDVLARAVRDAVVAQLAETAGGSQADVSSR